LQCSECEKQQYQDAPCLYANEPNADTKIWNEDRLERVTDLYASVSRRPQHGGSGRPYCGNAINLPEVNSRDIFEFRESASKLADIMADIKTRSSSQSFETLYDDAEFKSFSGGTKYYLQMTTILPERAHPSSLAYTDGDTYLPKQYPNNVSYNSLSDVERLLHSME